MHFWGLIVDRKWSLTVWRGKIIMALLVYFTSRCWWWNGRRITGIVGDQLMIQWIPQMLWCDNIKATGITKWDQSLTANHRRFTIIISHYFINPHWTDAADNNALPFAFLTNQPGEFSRMIGAWQINLFTPSELNWLVQSMAPYRKEVA